MKIARYSGENDFYTAFMAHVILISWPFDPVEPPLWGVGQGQIRAGRLHFKLHSSSYIPHTSCIYVDCHTLEADSHVANGKVTWIYLHDYVMRKTISAWKTGKKMVQFAALVLVACASDENGKDYFVSSRNGS